MIFARSTSSRSERLRTAHAESTASTVVLAEAIVRVGCDVDVIESQLTRSVNCFTSIFNA